MTPSLKIGTRSSRLAQRQAESALHLLQNSFPAFSWELALFSSPGDRDQTADLVSAPGDFFTRDLDNALLAGTIDCAVHSAKDLPDPLPEGIDWVWLPEAADPRDVWVGSLAPKIVGVSSDRRSDYVRRRFPEAALKPLRGTIEERLAKLDAGEYDALLMAAAALQRLGKEDRIAEWIDPQELPVPAGQGALALTFRADDARLVRLRSLFVKPVVFAGAGTRAGLCTQDALTALRRAEVCLYDALMDDALLAELPPAAQKIYVGKRSGQHSSTQSEICAQLVRFARQGCRVVRLKGGDPGIYGRLAEELDALDAAHLPYRVIPGVSSLTAATTGTGLLLTRRGVADRFRVSTAKTAAGGPSGETQAVFMGIQSLEETTARLRAEGASPDLPVSVVLDAGGVQQRILSGTLATIATQLAPTEERPGLILIGEAAAPQFLYQAHGALRGKRVWLTCSRDVQERAAQAVLDHGGIPVQQPLIELVPATVPGLENYDWLILTSPSAVRCLLAQLDDLRRLPKILCCGEGTAAALAVFRVRADAMPEGEFNTAGVLRTALAVIPPAARILRLRSDRAGERLSQELRKSFTSVRDEVICHNRPVRCDLPPCEAIFFASVSGVESFVAQFGIEKLAEKTVAVIGARDAAALRRHGVQDIIAPRRSTVEEAVEALAAHCIQHDLTGSAS
jgi:uroporphyrinogen III methyltransferase/synthase